MSAVGKARSNDKSFEAFQMEFNSRIEGLISQNTNIDHAQFFTTAEPSTNFQQLYFNVSGDIITGSVGYSASIVEIATGAIDIGRTSGKYASHVIVQAETGTTDTLTDINNFVLAYQDITIQADTGDTITVNETGNIVLPTGTTTLDLGPGDQLRLRYDIRTNKWTAFFGTGSGGGGSGTPPFEYGITLIATTTGNAILDLNPNSGAKGQHFIFTNELTGDVDITFSNPPPDGFSKPFIIEYTFGATVFDVTFNDPTDVIPLAGKANSTTKLSGYATNNGGLIASIFTMTSTAGSGTPFSGDLSDLTIDVTKNWLAQGITNFGNLTGVTGLTMTGATATLQGVNIIDLDGSDATIVGVKLIDFFQADQSIDAVTGGLEYTVGDLQEHLFKSQTTSIARFEEISANLFRLDMLDHRIKDALNITFSDASGNTIFAGASPTIGYNSTLSALILNVPTGGHIGVSENITVGSTEIFDDSIISDTLTADSELFIGILGTSPPTVTGQFTNDNTDVFVFSGSAARNLSNIPTSPAATTELDNLTTTAINAALVPNAGDTFDLGSSANPWRIIHGKQLEIITASASAPSGASDTQISRNVTGVGAAAINHFNFNVVSEAASSLEGQYDFYFDGATPVSITKVGTLTSVDAGAVDLTSHIQLQSQSTEPLVNGRISLNTSGFLQLHADAFEVRRTTTGGLFNQFNIVKVDPAPSSGEPIAEINFQLFDSPSTITYAQIKAEMENVTNAGQIDFNVRANSTLAAGMRIIGRSGSARYDIDFRPDTILKTTSGNMGYFVTSDPDNLDNIGTAGTLQIPIFTNGSPSLTDLNQALGAFDGATGYETVDNRLYVRESSTEWSFWTRDGSVT